MYDTLGSILHLMSNETYFNKIKFLCFLMPHNLTAAILLCKILKKIVFVRKKRKEIKIRHCLNHLFSFQHVRSELMYQGTFLYFPSDVHIQITKVDA